MPMPRPRILGSPRIKGREMENQKNAQNSLAQVSSRNSDEPDCEIIKIDNEDEEEKNKPLRESNGTMTIEVSESRASQQIGAMQFVKQCSMRLQNDYNGSSSQSIITPISPSLALQFVPDTSGSSAVHAKNIYSSQNVVMVLPVNSASSQVFNSPTLCTLQRIDNPNEISNLRKIVGTQQGARRSTTSLPPLCAINVRRETKGRSAGRHKKMLQRIFMSQSNDKRADANARSLIPWKKTERKVDTVYSSSNQTNLLAVSSQTIGNVVSFNGTSNCTTNESSASISTVDIQECFVSVSNNPRNSGNFVSNAGADTFSSESANSVTLENETRTITQLNVSTSIHDPLDISECFVSVSNVKIKNSYVDARTSLNRLSRESTNIESSVDRQNRSYSRSKGSKNIVRCYGNNKRPIPPLTKIIDKSKARREQNVSISISRESPDNVSSVDSDVSSIMLAQEQIGIVNSSGIEENSVIVTQESSGSVTSLETEENSITVIQETADSVTSSRTQNETTSTSKELLGSCNSSEILTASISEPETLDSRRRSISEHEGNLRNVQSLGNTDSSMPLKELTIAITPLKIDKDSTYSSRSKEPIVNNDVSEDRQNSSPTLRDTDLSENDEPYPTTNLIETLSCELIDPPHWKPRCIACKRRFSDRMELHRHATLTHPDVQILFCDLCNDSFLTDRELKDHRSTYCDRISGHDNTPETFAVDDENEHFLLSNAKSTTQLRQESSARSDKSSKQRVSSIESSPGNSRTSKDRSRLRSTKERYISLSGNTNNSSCSLRSNSSETERRKPLTKNKTTISRYSYVEEDVARHSAVASRSKFKSAEIKQLIVPLTRLDGPLLERYMEKLATRPVQTFGRKIPITRGNIDKLKVPSSNVQNNGNLRRGQRKKWPSMKLRREKYVKLRESRRAEENRRDAAIERDADSDETLDTNYFPSTLKDRSISEEYSANDEVDTNETRKIKISVSNDRAIRRNFDADTEDDTDSSAVKLVSKSHSNGIEEKTIRRQPWRTRKRQLDKKCSGSSDEQDDKSIIFVQKSLAKDQKIIRKLTSRSSAGSVGAMKKKRRIGVSGNATLGSRGRGRKSNVRSTRKNPISSGRKKDSSPRASKNKLLVSSSRSDLSTGSAASLAKDFASEIKETGNEETTTKDSKEIPKEAEKSQRNSTASLETQQKSKNSRSPSSFPLKTYLPSRRCSETLTKLREQSKKARMNATLTNDLCFTCEELLTVMKQVTEQLKLYESKTVSVQCPFCELHFISTFYLEEHVAGNHLNCRSETPCRRSQLFARSNAKLDCETEIELALECPQCPTKFANEEILNEHVISNHDISTPPRYISSRDTPDYLKDLSSTCFRIGNREKIVKASTKSPRNKRSVDERIFDASDTKIIEATTSGVNDNSVENRSSLVCWICESAFAESTEYIRHVSEIHDILIDEIPSQAKLNSTDQMIADREYLLKQLLSDDSSDGFEKIDDSEIEIATKEVRVDDNVNGSTGKRVIGHLSASHTCKICFKEFNRTQDLLMHSLSHENNAGEREAKFFRSGGIEKPRIYQDSFVISSESEDTTNVDKVVFKNCTKREGSSTNDNIFATQSDDEDTDSFFAIQGLDETRQNNKRRAMKFIEHPKKSPNLNSSRTKRSRSEKALATKSETNKRLDEKRSALKEFLDTEAALANTNGTNASDRVPIECGKCNRKFPNQASLNEHLFFLHDDSLKNDVMIDVLKKEEPKQRERWRCRACRQDFKLLQGYRRHRYQVHGDESLVHVCENCCKILTTVTMVNVHMCTDVASFNCRTCDKTFADATSLRLHNSEKHVEDDTPNVCEPCNKTFLTKSMLSRHVNSQHRFLRPYRPRKRSPVLMATQENVPTDGETADRIIDISDEDDIIDLESESRESPDKSHKRTFASSTSTRLPRKRCRVPERKRIANDSRSTKHVEIHENEIYRCSICQLYCLTKSMLESHMAKSHLDAMKICQLCGKFYADGKVLRHLLDYHLNPCDDYTEKSDSAWNNGEDTDERDVESFVRILGIQRLTTLWDYRRCEETTDDRSIDCSACEANFNSTSLYRLHVFTNHDTLCLLCNIEFKSAGAAAKHKTEEHRSAGCYMWFVDRTLRELNAVKTLRQIVERSLIDMISRESNDAFVDDLQSEPEEASSSVGTSTGTFETADDIEETEVNDNRSFSQDSEEKLAETKIEDNENLIVVVTDEDLEKYNIGTRYPNIWGLASHISSTCEYLTPKDVKEMLESYFEN